MRANLLSVVFSAISAGTNFSLVLAKTYEQLVEETAAKIQSGPFARNQDLPADIFLDGTDCSQLPVFEQSGQPQTWPNGDPVVIKFFNFCYNEDLGTCQCPPGSNTGVGGSGLICTEEDACIGINRCHLDATCQDKLITDLILPNNVCPGDEESGYNCICSEGLEGDGFHSDPVRSGCDNINECLNSVCGSTLGTWCINNDPRDQIVGEFSSNIFYDCACHAEGIFYQQIITLDGDHECHDFDYCQVHAPCGIDPNVYCLDIDGQIVDEQTEQQTQDELISEAYECFCNSGFNLINENGNITCQDINECDDIIAECGVNTNCENTHGSFSCSCREGFEENDIEDPSVLGCHDINECANDGVICGVKGPFNCVNLNFDETGMKYDCNCLPGYELNDDFTVCVDINECNVDGSCPFNAACTNSDGSFECECLAGFELVDNKCDDIDECHPDIKTCHSTATCVNTPGSHICTCDNFGDPETDIGCYDEEICLYLGSMCDNDPVSKCVDSPIGPECVCPSTVFENYETVFNDDGSVTCRDIDECVNVNQCPDKNTRCVNTSGYFGCPCVPGTDYTFDYLSFSFTCQDIDECELFDSCQDVENSDCHNTDGSYHCNCHLGWIMVEDVCEDFDECTYGEYDCGANSQCINTDGGYACECNNGYEISLFDPKDCVNIVECNTDYHNCGDNMICEDLEGSFECHCFDGYEEITGNTTETRFCADINECIAFDKICPVNKYCVNMEPGFDCVCENGLREELVDGLLECIDIDECNLNSYEACPFESAICINNFAGWSCDCVDGYEMIKSYEEGSGYGFDVGSGAIDTVCVDVDECQLDVFACPDLHAVCTNSVGSFDCTCTNGYDEVYTGDEFTGCVDMNECEVIPGICPAHSSCINHQPPQSWECVCNDGYYGGGIWRLGIDGDSDGDMCFDINECSAGIFECQENSSCVNTPGSYSCKCDFGFDDFTIDEITTCHDIDECIMSPCPENSVCNNTSGSFFCECSHGFMDLYGDGHICEDINECEENVCDQLCSNIHGSFECSCYPGYAAFYNDTDHINCVDINECGEYEGSGDICPSNSICSNTDGSFNCVCNPGYAGDGMITGCHDVDECIEDTHSCSDYAYCKNDMGTHYCECIPGFNGDGIICEDINECIIETHSCHADAKCTNTIGSYACTCKIGFEGHGFACDNINECDVFNDEHVSSCHENSMCLDTKGSYFCKCNQGFIDMYGDGSVCEDINECEESVCDQLCTNIHGSFECSCFKGYEAILNHDTNRVECIDIDECATGVNKCNLDAICTNTDGSYICECNNGFKELGAMNDIGDFMSGVNCADIDECLDVNACPENSNCVNMSGSYDCTCKDGFEWVVEDNGTPMIDDDFMVCVDINECVLENDCHQTAVCVNKPGGYNCECGNFGDPNTGCLERPSCDDDQICGANAVCVDTDNGAKCECQEGFFGDNNGANGQECFSNFVFEEMINDIKEIYRLFVDTNIPIGKSSKLNRKVSGATIVFLRILGRKAAETKWRMACLSENISSKMILSMQEYIYELKTNSGDFASIEYAGLFRLFMNEFISDDASKCTQLGKYEKKVRKVEEAFAVVCDKWCQ